MRTERQNPFYQRFGHALPATGRYPARDVDILWNRGQGGLVRDVEAVFIPRSRLRDDPEAPMLWRRFNDYNRAWSCALGNSCTDWLELHGLSPEMVFDTLLSIGFASRIEHRRALREFSHIEECAWARRMLSGGLHAV